MVTKTERDAILEAVADGVLDAMRERKKELGLRLSDMLAIANDARRRVEKKLSEEVPS